MDRDDKLMPRTKVKYIELYKSKNGWRWRLKSRNGEILCASENYSSKTKANKTARMIHKELSYSPTEWIFKENSPD